MGNNWFNLINLLKRMLISTEIVHQSKKKNIYELAQEGPYEFRDLEKRINPDNLIYNYKTESISLKDFRNYQNPIQLFKDLRDDNIHPKEVLKDQINFKSDLCKIKSEIKNQTLDNINPKEVLKDQINFKSDLCKIK